MASHLRARCHPCRSRICSHPRLPRDMCVPWKRSWRYGAVLNLPGSAGASLLTAGSLWVPKALPAVPPLRVPSALRRSVLAAVAGAVVSMPVIPQENWKCCWGLRTRGNSDSPSLPLRRCHVLQLLVAGLGTSMPASASLELQPSHNCSTICPAHRSVGVHVLGRAEFRCGQGEE